MIKIFIPRRLTTLVGCTTMALLLMAADDKPKGPPPAPVVVADVVSQELVPITWAAGTVVGRQDAKIAAELPGRLKWVAEVGATVKAGEAVARLDDTPLKLQLAELEAQVQKERTRLVFLKQEADRWQALARESNAAQSKLEQAQSEANVVDSELQSAKARLASGKDRLGRHVLKASFNSIVTERFKNNGEWVNSGEVVVRLVDPQNNEIQARIPLASIEFLSPGTKVRLQSQTTTVFGVIRALVPVGDERSRLLDLRVTFQEANWTVGQSLRVAVPLAQPRQVVAVPRDALVLRRTGVSVYKLAPENKAERVEVTTGISDGDLIEVQGGVKPGDKVIVRGAERLRPGQSVKVLPAKNQQAKQ